jgi:hypothetical protein
VAAADEKTHVEGIPAEDPVNLVPPVLIEFGLKLRLIGKQRHRHSCRGCQRCEASVFALPPGSRLGVVGKKNAVRTVPSPMRTSWRAYLGLRKPGMHSITV